MKTTFVKLKTFLQKYSHAVLFLYALIYMPWFTWLEKTVTSDYYVIHSVFDDYIPFCEYFIVPYLMWFLYIAATLLYFFFCDKRGFYKATTLMFSGMTIFLIICTVFPNGLNLRPVFFQHDNIFVDLVKRLYMTDTPTNVLPSLHVYNSICCHLAIADSRQLQKHRFVQHGSFILATLIVLSTMFLKQHSVVDVIAGFVMAYFLYQLVYVPERKRAPKLARQTI